MAAATEIATTTVEEATVGATEATADEMIELPEATMIMIVGATEVEVVATDETATMAMADQTGTKVAGEMIAMLEVAAGMAAIPVVAAETILPVSAVVGVVAMEVATIARTADTMLLAMLLLVTIATREVAVEIILPERIAAMAPAKLLEYFRLYTTSVWDLKSGFHLALNMGVRVMDIRHPVNKGTTLQNSRRQRAPAGLACITSPSRGWDRFSFSLRGHRLP